MRIFACLLLLGLSGCATTSATPEKICHDINPDPSMLALMSPVDIAPGIKMGSLSAVVRDGRCEITSAVYVNTQEVGLDRAREFRRNVAELAESQWRQSLEKYPPGALKVRYQFLPTPPVEPFIVELESGGE